LIVQIRRADNTYSSIEINTDSSGYSSTNLLPGTYTYRAIQNSVVATGQFQVFPNRTQDVTVEITGFRLYNFYLKASTGEIITNASVYVYDMSGNSYISSYADNNGACRFYLTDNKTYNYLIHTWDTNIQTDMKSFIVNEQNVSKTIMFYPVTFRLRNTDGSKFGSVSNFIFNNTYSYTFPSKTDENSDPVFLFPSGHYTYQFYSDSSYPALGGSFDVDSSSVVVNYINPTHEVKFEFKDSNGNYLPGAVRIDNPYLDFSTWGDPRPLSIHLPDGEYDCLVWSSSCGVGTNEKLIIAGKDTTIAINHHKLTVNILNNNNEPLDFYVSMSSETGSSVTVNKINTGTYTADVLNGKYNFLAARSGNYYSYNSSIIIQDADTTVNIVLNQFRLNVKTDDGKIINDMQIYITDENNNYLYNGNGEASLYLADGRYFYRINSNNYYFTKVDTFELNGKDKEITLLAYPVTFRVTLNNQIPVLNYNLYFNGSGANPDQKDEFSSTYLLLQGEYDYEVSTKSLLGNNISNRGKVTADDSKEIPVTFYSAEFSVMLDGMPFPGSRIHLWQDDSQYYNSIDLSVNEDGKIRDYVSNGLYHYTINPENGGNSYSGTFSADSQNVNINVDFYSVHFHFGQSSVTYYIYIKNIDTGEDMIMGPEWNNPVFTTRLTPGHYVYDIYNAYYYYFYDNDNLIFTEGEFIVDNQPVDINDQFLPHNFIISNPYNKYIYGFTIYKNAINIMNTYIYDMDTLTYYLPKGEYSYDCYGSDMTVSGDFTVENSNDTTYILLDNNTGIQTIKDESDFRIFPNPAHDMIWFNRIVDGEISIATIDGKTILHQTLYQQESLNISNLRKGTYMVRINENKSAKIIVKKLVVK